MKASKGFTLIELVVVIVILGILAATALPKFIDLSGDAKLAAFEGVAGAISSASAINYGGYSANSSKGVHTTGMTCATAVGKPATNTGMLQGGLPSGYSLDDTAALVQGNNTCALTQTGTVGTKDIIVIGVP
jgi:MSHA pilin protein MshA